MLVGDAALAARLERVESAVGAAYARAVMVLHPEIGASVLEIAGGLAMFTGPSSPITQAIGLAMGRELAQGELETLEEFYKSREAPVIVHVTPWTDASLTRALAAAPYAIVEWQNVFARKLTQADIVNDTDDTAIQVEEGTDPELFARISAEGFATPEMDAAMLHDVARPMASAEHARCYIAWLDDQPAGAATMFTFEGVAGLYGAATVPAFRNRGVQAALLRRRLSDAARDDCDLAIVTTMPGSGSHRNVSRRGFEVAYAKISMRRDF